MLTMAFRNLLRNKRRTIITLVSIVFATFLTSFVRYMVYGVEIDMVDRAVASGSGYLQVAAYGWLESNRRLDRALDFTPDMQQKLAEAGIKDYTPRIDGGALVGYEEESRFIRVNSFDVDRERNITRVHEKIIEGFPLDQGDDHPFVNREGRPVYNAVIGYRLAGYLGAHVGSEITLVTSQFDGSVGAIIAKVKGIIRADQLDVDGNRVFLTLGTGRVLFAPGAGGEFPRYTSIAISAHDSREALKLKEKLSDLFPEPVTDVAPEDSAVFDPVVLDYDDLNPELSQLLIISEFKNETVIIILLVIMIFGLLTTLELSIHERTFEFGIMMAIGTRGNRLVLLILMEMTLLLLIGIAIGIAGGSLLAYYYELNPIVFTGDLAKSAVENNTVARLRPVVDLAPTYIEILTFLTPSLLLSWWGASRIKKLQPVEVIGNLG